MLNFEILIFKSNQNIQLNPIKLETLILGQIYEKLTHCPKLSKELIFLGKTPIRLKELLIQGVPKKCPCHILYVNDNLLYAHLHRLHHLRFATFFFIGFKFTWGKSCLLYTSPSPRDS